MKEKNRKLEAESTILKQQLYALTPSWVTSPSCVTSAHLFNRARPASSPNSAIFKTPLKPKKAEEDTKAAAQPTLVPPQRYVCIPFPLPTVHLDSGSRDSKAPKLFPNFFS
jgi:hypothetical protein